MNSIINSRLNEGVSNEVLKTFWEDFTLEEDAWIPFKRFKYLIENDISVHSYLEDKRVRETGRGDNGQ